MKTFVFRSGGSVKSLGEAKGLWQKKLTFTQAPEGRNITVYWIAPFQDSGWNGSPYSQGFTLR